MVLCRKKRSRGKMRCFVLRAPGLLTKGRVCPHTPARAQTQGHVCMWSKYSFLPLPESLCAMGKVVQCTVFFPSKRRAALYFDHVFHRRFTDNPSEFSPEMSSHINRSLSHTLLLRMDKLYVFPKPTDNSHVHCLGAQEEI